MRYDGGNTTGFASPAAIYLEDPIDLAALLDLRRPNIYVVRVSGVTFPLRGIAHNDILIVNSALDRRHDALCVVMAVGEVFLAILKYAGRVWFLVRGDGSEVALTDDAEVWGIVSSMVREAV